MTAFAGSHMQLKVELLEMTPSIWRRLVVPADIALDVLHEVLQIAFGWKDSHLHDFHAGDVRFGMVDVDDELLSVDERAAPLGAIARVGSSLIYRYDFGDRWEHEITIESIVEPTRAPLRVECRDGARACPPEDCGGVPGYENMLRVLGDPKDEEHADMRRWVGRAYDPEKFEIEKVNKKLGVIGRRLERMQRAAWRR